MVIVTNTRAGNMATAVSLPHPSIFSNLAWPDLPSLLGGKFRVMVGVDTNGTATDDSRL